MLKYFCALGCYCFIISLTFTNAEIAVRAAVGGSFRLHVFPKPFDNPISCILISPQNVVTDIPLNYEASDNQTSDQKIEPLGNGQCGARVHDTLARNDAGRWTLTFSNEEQSVNETFRITTFTWETIVNRTTAVALGSERLTLLCGPSANMLYCELRDPSGNLAALSHRTRCQTLIAQVTISHFGTWTCTVGVIGGTSEVYATHTLEILENSNEAVIFTNETSLGTWISWQIHGMSGTSLWCRAFPPNGQTIMVLPGMENEKYVSIATNLAEHKCGLLINGGLSEEYHGLWRLEIGVNARRAMGGFIRMPEGTIPGPNDNYIRKNVTRLDEIAEMNVTAGSSFRISCETPYSAGYCWIGGPLGQEFTHSENLTVGRCAQVINGSTAADHSGIWTCNMAHMHGGPEEQFVTRVNVMEEFHQSVYTEIDVALGEKAHIACLSILELPREYCRFIRPDGKGFGVVPGVRVSDRYAYEGPGLDHGYCGLSISSVEAVDIGEWRCASRTRSRLWEAEEWGRGVLELRKTTLETFSLTEIIIGLTIGVFLILFIIIMITVLIQKRKSFRRASEETVIVKSNL